MRAWLTERAGFHVHDAPIYVSWLNQVEGWFAVFTSPQIRRGSFASAKDLSPGSAPSWPPTTAVGRIFAWTATIDKILARFGQLVK